MPITRVSKRVGGRRMYGKRKLAMMRSVRMSPDTSRYLKSVLNPSYGGAKIPDSFGAKSCTIQLQREITVPISSGKAGGLLQVSIAPCAFSLSGGNWDLPIMIDGSGAYNAWNDTSVANADLVASKLPQLFRSARVVSAGIKVQYSGTTQNDQGTLTLFSVDRTHIASLREATVTGGYNIGNPDVLAYVSQVPPLGVQSSSSVVPAAGSGADLRNLPVNAFGPLRLGGTCRYFPIDDTDLDFHPYAAQSATIEGSGFPNWWNPASTGFACFGNCRTGTVAGLGFLVEDAATVAGGSVIVQYTVNLECIVKDDSFNIVQTSSSPVDPLGMAAAARVYLRKPQVRVGSGGGDTESINVYNR